MVVSVRGRPLNVMAFNVAHSKFVEINVVADPESGAQDRRGPPPQ
jgi:hypothetical protein